MILKLLFYYYNIMGIFDDITNGISSTWNDTTSVIGNVTSGAINTTQVIGTSIESGWNDVTTDIGNVKDDIVEYDYGGNISNLVDWGTE